MSRVVRVLVIFSRILAVFTVVLTLLSWGFGISAILHPVSCPGAFIGCSENGGETSYYLGYLVCLITVVASILALILSERRPVRTGKGLFRLLFAVSLAFSPFFVGLVLSIYLSAYLPGYGIFAFLLILAKKWEEVKHTDTIVNVG